MNKYIFGVVFLLIIWFLWPIYEFYAHKGKLAFPPFYQFITIPEDKPKSQLLANERYRDAGGNTLALISQHQSKINAPAISVAVAFDEEVVWAGVSGWADVEEKIPAKINTQFRIGSTSKALTSIGLARAVDRGLIDVESPISRYMEELPNSDWANITVRQLASHTSGLPHYKENSDLLGLYKSVALDTRYEKVNEALEVFDDSKLLFEPGTAYSYSSFGTVLLSAVLESATRTPYLQWMKQQVFSPLSLQSTAAEYDNATPESLAEFYWNDKGRSRDVRIWRNVDLSHRLAGGGFVSTSSELVKLGSAFLNENFVSGKTRTEFWKAKPLPSGDMPPYDYAIGWRKIMLELGEDIGQVQAFNHGGVTRGAQSWLMVIPEYNMAVAVNINANTDNFSDFSRIALDIAKEFILTKVSHNF